MKIYFQKFFQNIKLNLFFHLAAIVSVQKSIENPVLSNEVNLLGTIKLLQHSYVNQVNRVVFASSAAVYGDEPSLPKNEKSITRPISPYGVEKLAAETYMNLYSNVFNLETIILRYFNVYGSRQDPTSEYSGVISIFEEKFSKNDCPTIYGDGTQYRDFINIKDIVKINMESMHQQYDEINRLICCGTGVKTSINSLFKIFCKKYNKQWKEKYASSRKGDIYGSIADNSKMIKLLKNTDLIGVSSLNSNHH